MPPVPCSSSAAHRADARRCAPAVGAGRPRPHRGGAQAVRAGLARGRARWSRTSSSRTRRRKLDVLLAQRPREPQARFLKGVAQTEQGRTPPRSRRSSRWSRTIPSCRSRTTTSPCSTRRKASTKARASRSRSAVKAAPDWAVAHENLGDIYVRLGAAEYATAREARQGTTRRAAGKLALARELLARPREEELIHLPSTARFQRPGASR